MRESNIGHELKDMAQEVVRFGERCVQAGRDWLNERRDEMNHRNDEGRHEYQSGQQYGQGARGSRGTRESRGQYEESGRSRGEYYGGGQSNERMQSAGWDEDRGNWEYEGGPERYGGSEMAQQGYRQGQYRQGPYGSQYGQQYTGEREYGSQQNIGSSNYYRGRQGYGPQGSFGSEYDTYGRNQGFGEGSGYTRPQQSRWQQGGSQFGGRQGYMGSGRYGGESAGYGGRGPLHSSGYTDEGEMSGYGGRELSTQQYGSGSTGRYGPAPGQYGYGGYGAGGRSFRGVGPKNYLRSDERLTEDINERLTDDDDLDASDINVRVSDGKVTLEGNVDHRWMKHRAEDIADACTGVKEVDNRIQVISGSASLGQTATTRGAGSRTSQSGAGTTTTGTSGTSGGTTTPH